MNNPCIPDESLRMQYQLEEVDEIGKNIRFCENSERMIKDAAENFIEASECTPNKTSGMKCPLCGKGVIIRDELWECTKCIKSKPCPLCKKSNIYPAGEDEESCFYVCGNRTCKYEQDIVISSSEVESTTARVTKKNTTKVTDNSIKKTVSVTSIRDSAMAEKKTTVKNGTVKQTKIPTKSSSPKQTVSTPRKEVSKNPTKATDTPVQSQPTKKAVPSQVKNDQKAKQSETSVTQKKILMIPSIMDVADKAVPVPKDVVRKRKLEEFAYNPKKSAKTTEENIGMSPMEEEDEFNFSENPNYKSGSKEWSVLEKMNHIQFYKTFYEYLAFSYFKDNWDKTIAKSKTNFSQHVVKEEMRTMFSTLVAASCAGFGDGLDKLIKQIGFHIEYVSCADIEMAGARKLQQNESENCYISDKKGTTDNPLKHITISFKSNNNGVSEKKEIQIFALDSWYNFLVYLRNASGLLKFCTEIIEKEAKDIPKDLDNIKKIARILNNKKLRKSIYEDLKSLHEYFMDSITEEKYRMILSAKNPILSGPVVALFENNIFDGCDDPFSK